jgi:hypothetical protein
MSLVNALKIAVALAVGGGIVTLFFRLATARDLASRPPSRRGRKEEA